jgi:hypothetical protein
VKHITLAFVVLALSATVFGQKKPTYASYSAKVERIRNIKVDLSSKDARMYRTNLRNATKAGVNFAGRYILTGWGCGTNCSEWAIIDGRSGKVYFPKELAGVGYGFCELPENAMPSDSPTLADDADGPVYFKKDSRLVVLTGFTGGGLNDDKAKCGNYFFEWTGTRLRQVKFIAGRRTDTP